MNSKELCCGAAHSHDGHSVFSHEDEEPCVCSFAEVMEQPQPIRGSVLAGQYSALVDALCQWCADRELLVGHIKLHLHAAGEDFWASNTGNATHNKSSSGWDVALITAYRLAITAIVFQTDLEPLKQTIRMLLQTINSGELIE